MKKILILITICCAFCFSCNKKTHCPALPASLNYYPYYEGQVLQYVNSQQEIQNFVIAYIEDYRKSYICERTLKCPECCECSHSLAVRTNYVLDAQISYMYAHFSVGGGGPEIISSANMSFLFTCSLEDNRLEKTLFENEKIPYNKIDQFFNDTISIENVNNELIHKIMIVKNKGLVSYTTADGEEWKLVE